MIQLWIMRADTPPHDAQKSGLDAAVCGGCKLRPSVHSVDKANGTADSAKPCYVITYRLRATWEAAGRAEVDLSGALAKIKASGRAVRFGAYGNPSAVPRDILASIADAAPRHTGYDAEWIRSGADLRGLLMASVQTRAAAEEAWSRGWRTFRVLSTSESLAPNEIACPASKEAGARTTCADCTLCNGAREHDKRKSIAILAH